MTRIVMTGTTGHVGGGAIAELAAAGHDLCQIVRDPARAPAIEGVETVVAAAKATVACERPIEVRPTHA